MPFGGIAYAHPDCPEHGNPERDEDAPNEDDGSPGWYPDPQTT